MADYYELLGVSRDATTEEIRRAYRKKAREFHPDTAGPEFEDQFKNISAAYEVLSDPDKRQRYDLGGYSTGGFGGTGPAGGFGFADIFDAMFGGSAGFGGQPQRGRAGQDLLLAVEVTLAEIMTGVTKEVMVDSTITCETCEGSGAKPGTSPVTCSTCAGRGSVTRLQRAPLLGDLQVQVPCPDCQGRGQRIEQVCPECGGEQRVHAKRRISVDVPAGVRDGAQIRLTGQGEAGTGGAPSGDLYVEIREKPDSTFTRRGQDLHTSITVPMTVAALGTQFELSTFDGPEEVVIPAGTQPAETITLPGLGIPHMRSAARGDLYVHVGVEVPRSLDQKSKDLLEQLADLRGEERVEVEDTKTGGLFGRFRSKRAG